MLNETERYHCETNVLKVLSFHNFSTALCLLVSFNKNSLCTFYGHKVYEKKLKNLIFSCYEVEKSVAELFLRHQKL
jgi:hypothetical protein